MSVAKWEIEFVFKKLLKRDPEGPAIFDNNRSLENVDELIRKVARSPEFVRRIKMEMQNSNMVELRALADHRIVFLHIPKCGGTTLHNVLLGWFGAKSVHRERFNNLYSSSVSDLASKKVFSGHFDYFSTHLIPGNKTLVTFMRDPIDRLISLYNFHRAHRVKHPQPFNYISLASELAIDDYFQQPKLCAASPINNTMVRHLSDLPQTRFEWAPDSPDVAQNIEALTEQSIRNLGSFDCVGFLDEYDSSISKIAKVVGKPAPATIEKHQVLETLPESNPNIRKITKQYPSDKTLKRMEELVAYDYVLYRAAKERFGTQKAAV